MALRYFIIIMKLVRDYEKSSPCGCVTILLEITYLAIWELSFETSKWRKKGEQVLFVGLVYTLSLRLFSSTCVNETGLFSFLVVYFTVM